ncbi:MAG: PQQ-dependent sugar dehydrogenase [Chitinophagaceae bacterium]|nr:MAG: PQQ-dependent sugar dehydrogenase [Chitinophagaceae bacterium]
MRTFLLRSGSLILAASTVLSCSNRSVQAASTPLTDSSPVETNAPNTNYQPAFPNQTRVRGVHTSTPWEARILTRGLNRPWGLTALPDGRLLITEKGGTLRIVHNGTGALSAAITGLPAVEDAGQGGLLDVAIDPDFAQNRTIYWTFSERVSGGNLTAVGKGQLSADEQRVENARVIYRALPAYNGTLHYGGRLAFGRDGNLFVSTGERSDLATRPQAQVLTSALGKILRITRDGQPAPGNPFLGRNDALPELWSYGHRNVQGLAIHPETGGLWNSEMGPRGGDEVNRIEAGKNYGWPTITYGIEYGGSKIGQGITQQAGMEQPVYYWDPVMSPSGTCFYSGSGLAEWKNNLFLCGLSGQHIARLVIENGRVTGEERLLAGEGHRFRSITEGRDSALYAITDGTPGILYRIAKR